MPKVLANDGIAPRAQSILEEEGFEVDTEKVPDEKLPEVLQNYDAIVVRSATKLRKPIIDACPDLKFIGRAGVGMDNIDVDYAKSKGIEVKNTPAASKRSVAELVFAHLLGMVRYLYDANRQMPEKGSSEFKQLKKKYKGRELRDKTLGIIGFGRIGQEVARIAIAIGMRVLVYDRTSVGETMSFKLNGHKVRVRVQVAKDKKEVLHESDFLTLHIPYIEEHGPALEKEEFKEMKDGVGIVNCARGGVVDEGDLLDALDSGKVAYAGVDVFEAEPTDNTRLLQHPNVSLSPHIGAATEEAQERVGLEMADHLIAFFKQN